MSDQFTTMTTPLSPCTWPSADNGIAGITVIDVFNGDHRFLSNFYPCDVRWGGWQYPSVEHAFQAAKTLDVDKRAEILGAEAPGRAKRLGRTVELRPDWEDVKNDVMRILVTRKFADDLHGLLLDTGDAVLVEGNTWGDSVWGAVRTDGVWVGENRLGRILTIVRRRLQVEWTPHLWFEVGEDE